MEECLCANLRGYGARGNDGHHPHQSQSRQSKGLVPIHPALLDSQPGTRQTNSQPPVENTDKYIPDVGFLRHKGLPLDGLQKFYENADDIKF